MEYLSTPDASRGWLPNGTPGTGAATGLAPATRQAHIRDSFQSLFSPSLDVPSLGSGTVVPSPSLLGPRFTAPTPVLSTAVPIVVRGGSAAAVCPPTGAPSGVPTAVAPASAGAMDVPPSPARPDAVLSSPFLRQAAKDAVVREYQNTYLGDPSSAGGHMRFGLPSPAWSVLLPSTPGVGRPPPVPTPMARGFHPGVGAPAGPLPPPPPKRKARTPDPATAVASSPVKEEGANGSGQSVAKPLASPPGASPEHPEALSSAEGATTAAVVDGTQMAVGATAPRIPGDGAAPDAEAKLAGSAPLSMAVPNMPNMPAPYAAMMYGAPGLGMYMPSASMAAQMQQFQHWQQMYQQSASVGLYPTVPNAMVPPQPGQFSAAASALPAKETQEERKNREESEKETLTREFKKKTREAALLRFRQKRRDRKFGKLVRYTVRKALADGRPRVKGRFVKMADDAPGGGSSASVPMDSSDSADGSPSMTSADVGSLSLPRRASAGALGSAARGKARCASVSSR